MVKTIFVGTFCGTDQQTAKMAAGALLKIEMDFGKIKKKKKKEIPFNFMFSKYNGRCSNTQIP